MKVLVLGVQMVLEFLGRIVPLVVFEVIIEELVDYTIISHGLKKEFDYLLLNLARFSPWRSSPAIRVNS